MKTAPKTKAEKSSFKLKTGMKGRRTAPKSTSKPNGKHPPATYEHAPIGIVESSLEGKHLNVNEELCRILGFDKAELLQGGIKDFTHEEDCAIDVKLHGQLVEGKIPFYKLEKRYVRKDGEVVWVELTRSLVRDANGKPLYTIGVVLDISERKHVERVLRDSSERLRLATETAQMFMWEWDFENLTYTLPDNFTQVLGFSTGLSPKNGIETVQRLLPAEDLRAITDAFRNAIENRKDLHSLPCRVINPENGQAVWLAISAKIVYDYEGKPARMFGVAQNITENKAREEALGESEERFRALVSQATAGIAQTDFNGCFTFVNPKFCEMLGYSQSELIGMTIWELTYAEDLEKNKRLYERMITQGESYQFEKRFVRRDGSLLWTNVSVSAIRDLAGKPRGGVGVVVDINERKRAEKALQEKDKQLRQITDITPVLLSQCSSDLRYLFVNQAAAEFLGFGPEEIAGKPIREVMGDEAFETIRPYVERVLQGERVEYELEIPYRAAGRRFMHVIYVPEKNDSGTVSGWIATVTDITERKRMEHALAESVRQQEALYRLTDQLNRTISLDGGFALTLDTILEVLRCDRASILLFDDENVMRFVAWRGLSDAYRQAIEGHSPWKADEENPQPISINDVRTAELSDALRAVIAKEGIGSLAFIPLVSNGKLIGKFMVYFNTPHLFNEAEIELSQTIAHQLAFDLERERAEEKLRESEERYRVVVESQSEMLCRFQPDGTILFVNGAYAQARGTTPEELINHNFWEFVAEADHPAVKAMLDSLTPDAPEVHIENRFQTTDGERWTLWTNRALRFDSHGHLLEVQASGIDITERKQAEQRLSLLAEISELTRKFENPNELLFTISEVVGEHLQVKRCLFNEIDLKNDRETVHRDYCRGVESVAGIHKISDYSSITSAEMIAGKTVINYDSKIDPRTAQDYERSYAPNGERAYVAVPLMRENQWVASLWVSDDLPRQWSKEEVSLLETVAERTWTAIEKLRVDAALRASEERYRFIVENTSDGIWWIELTEPMPLTLSEDKQIDWYYQHAVIRQCNLGLARMYGYGSAEEVVGLPIRVIMPREKPVNLELSRQFIRSGYRLVDAESREIGKDGHERVFLNNMVGIIEDGKLRGEWGTNRDITERKRAEEALRASERLYRAIARNVPGGGMYVVDKEFRYLIAEGPVTEAFGLSREMLEGHTVMEVFPDESGSRMEERLRRTFAGESVEFETQFNGRSYWTQMAPLHDSIGQAIILTLDITERKQAEEALRQSEERFVRFMQHLPGLAWIKDLQGRYVYANAAAEKAFNTPREKLYGKTDEEVFPAEVAAQFRENDERALIEGIGVQVIETLNHDDSTLHYSLVNKFPIPGPDGETILIGGTAFDITERLQAEEALRASEVRYRNLFEFVPIAVYTCDAEGLIQEFNHRAVELWGREPKKNDPTEKYCGSFKIYYPDGRYMPHEACPMSRVLHGETLDPAELEILVERPDGKRRSVMAHPFPLKNESGEIIGAINCLYEITERKQAAESLRESEERFRAILRQATAGIVRKDAEGRFVYVNQAFCNMLGYTEGDLIGKTVWEFMHEEDIAENKRSFNLLMMEGVPFNLQRRFLREDGSLIWVDASVSPIMDAEGRPQSAVAVEVDITGRKQAEEALQQLNIQLESRVETRTAELRSAIQQLRESRRGLQILSQRLVDVQEEERRALARELHDRVGQTLAALNINLIIINSQLSADVAQQIGTRLQDSMDLVAETIALVRNVMTDLRPAVLDDYGLEAALESHLEQFKSRYEIKATLEKPEHSIPRLGPSLEMTFLRIAQEALMNIARHAQASEVKLSLRQEQDIITMTVQDNGIGIESWQEANRPGSHGLTIMRERAEAFGGTLQVMSATGKGTKVEASIPLKGHNQAQEERSL